MKLLMRARPSQMLSPTTACRHKRKLRGKDHDPPTPDITQKMSKRTWDGIVSGCWMLQLMTELLCCSNWQAVCLSACVLSHCALLVAISLLRHDNVVYLLYATAPHSSITVVMPAIAAAGEGLEAPPAQV
jgi:hypothetical protein